MDMSLENPPALGGPRQFHTFNISGTVFEVDRRYENLRAVGQGSYGLVCSADDVETGNKVAIKKVTDAFQDLIDAKRILREIKLLGHLGDHEDIIGLVDIVTMPSGTRDFNDVYIMTELMECDLDRIVSSNQPLSDQHAQYFLYQVLRGIKYIHSANVLHRDLKPSNVLVNSNCDLAICDFGLARGVNSEYQDTLTEYVVTRWYRAPELLTDSRYYGSAIDVWSIGCIFAEILIRRPMFQGRDYMHQLQVIVELLGTPSAASMAFITNESARRAISSFGHMPPKDFHQVFAGCSANAINLLQKCLVFDPHGRCTIEEALAHPYLAELHDEREEPTATDSFNLDYERGYRNEMPKNILQDLIFDEMCKFHPEGLDEEAEESDGGGSGARYGDSEVMIGRGGAGGDRSDGLTRRTSSTSHRAHDDYSSPPATRNAVGRGGDSSRGSSGSGGGSSSNSSRGEDGSVHGGKSGGDASSSSGGANVVVGGGSRLRDEDEAALESKKEHLQMHGGGAGVVRQGTKIASSSKKENFSGPNAERNDDVLLRHHK